MFAQYVSVTNVLATLSVTSDVIGRSYAMHVILHKMELCIPCQTCHHSSL